MTRDMPETSPLGSARRLLDTPFCRLQSGAMQHRQESLSEDLQALFQALENKATPRELAQTTSLPEPDVIAGLLRLLHVGLAGARFGGKLEHLSAAAILGTLIGSRTTGILSFESDGVQRQLRLVEGGVVGALSSAADEQLGDLLMREAVLSWEQLRSADASKEDGSGVIDAVTARALVTPSHLGELTTRHAVEVVRAVLQLSRGAFTVTASSERAVRSGAHQRLDPAELLLDSIQGIQSWSRIQAFVGESDTVYSLRPQQLPAELDLGPEEWSLLGCAAEARSLETLCHLSALPDFRVCQLVWFFHLMGILERSEQPYEKPLGALRTSLDELRSELRLVEEFMPEETIRVSGTSHKEDDERASGRLRPHKLADVLRALYRSRSTGTLSVVSDQVTNRLFLADGNVTAASSSAPEHRLGDTLRRMQLVDDATLEQSLRSSAPVPLGQLLLHSGVLTEAQLQEAITFQFHEVLKPMFNWSEGRFDFEPGKPAITDIPKHDHSTAELIFGGVRAMIDHSGVSDLLHGTLGKLAPARDPLMRFQQLRLRADEAALLARVDGRSNFQELLADSLLGSADTLRVLYALLATGVLELSKECAEPEHIQQHATTPETVPLQELLARDARLLEADHYAALEVPRDTPLEAIRAAYERLARLYHPDRGRYTAQQPTLERLFARVVQAWSVLSDNTTRQSYDALLDSAVGSSKSSAEGPARNEAERAYQRGSEALVKGDYATAIHSLEAATQLDSEHTAAFVALGEACTLHPPLHRRARTAFERALELDPLESAAMLGLGNLLEAAGKRRAAADMFSRASQLNPQDANIRAHLQRSSPYVQSCFSNTLRRALSGSSS